MKKKVVLVLLLIVCFSSQLSSETLDCEQSFELGRIAAKESKAWGWFWAGIGAGLVSLSVSAIVMNFEGETILPSLIGAIVVTDLVGLHAAYNLPLRSDILPSSSDVDIECYRDGYNRTRSRRNSGAFLLGDLTGFAVFGTLGFLCILVGMN